MADLEKVIEGLRCHSEPKFGPDEYFCETCSYDEATCGLDVPNDALSLLKAQQARLMTLDEVKKLPTETDVWIQHAGKFADDVIRAATVSEVTNASISFWFGGSLYYMNYGEKPYGWICWTSRPTDEQRKAVKWE